MLSQSQPVFLGNPSSVFEFFQESLTLVFRETKAFYRNLTIYMEMPDFAFDNCLIYTILCKSYLKTDNQPHRRNHYFCHQVDILIFTLFLFSFFILFYFFFATYLSPISARVRLLRVLKVY